MKNCTTTLTSGSALFWMMRVKVKYAKFGDLLAEVKAVTGKKKKQ
jgi:hypothetical protein